MSYTYAEHPVIWQIAHHPIITFAVALVVGVIVAWIYLIGSPTPGGIGFTDVNFGP